MPLVSKFEIVQNPAVYLKSCTSRRRFRIVEFGCGENPTPGNKTIRQGVAGLEVGIFDGECSVWTYSIT